MWLTTDPLQGLLFQGAETRLAGAGLNELRKGENILPLAILEI